MKKSDKGKNEVVPRATANFFEKYGKAAAQNSIVGRLLKFTKFGEYRAGQEEEEIERGTRLAAYMNSLCVGWQRWEDGRIVEKDMGPVSEGFVPPKRDTLGRTDKTQWDSSDDDDQPRDPWQFTNTVVLADLETKDLFTFSTSSKGGLKAIGQLALKYGEHLRQKPDEAPIIELGGGSYKHPNKKFGEIREPILKIVDYVPLGALPPLGDGQGQLQLDPPPDGNKGSF
jgi:hypothetical protein